MSQENGEIPKTPVVQAADLVEAITGAGSKDQRLYAQHNFQVVGKLDLQDRAIDIAIAFAKVNNLPREIDARTKEVRVRAERLANLEWKVDALIGHYAGMTREGLEAYTPEDRHAYKTLRLRVI